MGMSLMLLLSVFFTLLEMLHFYSLKRMEPLISQVSMESAFADYNRLLWTDYGILAIDGSYGTGVFDLPKVTERMSSYMEENAGITTAKGGSHGVSFLRMTAGTVTIDAYGVLTDDHGVPFMQLAAKQEMYETAEDVVDFLNGDAGAVTDEEHSQPDVNEILSSANDALSEAEEIAEEMEEDEEWVMGEDEEWDMEVSDEEIEEIGNPIAIIGRVIAEGWLSVVIPAGRTVSERSFADGARVSERTLEQGTLPVEKSLSMDEKILYLKFLTSRFSNFANIREHGGIQYELEYMIGGQRSDRDNLGAIVNRLMIAREAANYAHITRDPEKSGLASAVAIALVGFTGSEAIIKATQKGIMAAWALGESVLDVRALLSGKRISIVKSAEEWTLDLKMLSDALSGTMEAKDCPDGITYEQYIYGLLFVTGEKKLGLRGLDVMEDALHHHEDYRNVKADQMIYAMDVGFTYEAAPLFLSFVVLLDNKPGAYRYENRLSMTYIR